MPCKLAILADALDGSVSDPQKFGLQKSEKNIIHKCGKNDKNIYFLKSNLSLISVQRNYQNNKVLKLFLPLKHLFSFKQVGFKSIHILKKKMLFFLRFGTTIVRDPIFVSSQCLQQTSINKINLLESQFDSLKIQVSEPLLFLFRT